MNSDLLITAFVSAAITALIAVALWRKNISTVERFQAEKIANIRELEKRNHLSELDFLTQRGQIEIEHSESLKNSRAAAFEEGRLLGQSEANALRVNELSEQRQALFARFESDRELAIKETRNKLKAEYELQSKLFTVKISPYVSVEEEKKLFGHQYRTTTGYQYQLLVNGIPAFSPHVVAEQVEIKKAINPAVEQLLLKAAERAADTAINAYLGSNSQFAKLAEPILKRIPR